MFSTNTSISQRINCYLSKSLLWRVMGFQVIIVNLIVVVILSLFPAKIVAFENPFISFPSFKLGEEKKYFDSGKRNEYINVLIDASKKKSRFESEQEGEGFLLPPSTQSKTIISSSPRILQHDISAIASDDFQNDTWKSLDDQSIWSAFASLPSSNLMSTMLTEYWKTIPMGDNPYNTNNKVETGSGKRDLVTSVYHDDNQYKIFCEKMYPNSLNTCLDMLNLHYETSIVPSSSPSISTNVFDLIEKCEKSFPNESSDNIKRCVELLKQKNTAPTNLISSSHTSATPLVLNSFTLQEEFFRAQCKAKFPISWTQCIKLIESLFVTSSPTLLPSTIPSLIPSTTPSASPSFTPSTSPSTTPSALPSLAPSSSPSASPSFSPSASPSLAPSAAPSFAPSASPSLNPNASPSLAPSASPNASPSFTPSTQPITALSTTPSIEEEEKNNGEIRLTPLEPDIKGTPPLICNNGKGLCCLNERNEGVSTEIQFRFKVKLVNTNNSNNKKRRLKSEGTLKISKSPSSYTVIKTKIPKQNSKLEETLTSSPSKNPKNKSEIKSTKESKSPKDQSPVSQSPTITIEIKSKEVPNSQKGVLTSYPSEIKLNKKVSYLIPTNKPSKQIFPSKNAAENLNSDVTQNNPTSNKGTGIKSEIINKIENALLKSLRDKIKCNTTYDLPQQDRTKLQKQFLKSSSLYSDVTKTLISPFLTSELIRNIYFDLFYSSILPSHLILTEFLFLFIVNVIDLDSNCVGIQEGYCQVLGKVTITTKNSTSEEAVCNVGQYIHTFFSEINAEAIDDSLKEILFLELVNQPSMCTNYFTNTLIGAPKSMEPTQKIILFAFLIAPLLFCFCISVHFWRKRRNDPDDMNVLISEDEKGREFEAQINSSNKGYSFLSTYLDYCCDTFFCCKTKRKLFDDSTSLMSKEQQNFHSENYNNFSDVKKCVSTRCNTCNDFSTDIAFVKSDA